MLHEYASEFTSAPEGEIFCKLCDCLGSEKCEKVYGGSASPQCKASTRFVSWNWKMPDILKHAIPDFADKLVFVSFQQIFVSFV